MSQPLSLQLRLTLLVGLLSGGMALLFALLVYPLTRLMSEAAAIA
jgi:hypothetical protein